MHDISFTGQKHATVFKVQPTTSHTHKHTHPTVLRPFFRDHPGEPVPEENFWTLWCKGRLTEADTLTIRLGVIPSRRTSAHLHHHPMFFYGLDALPAAQPTVSKHWRQKLTTSQQSLNGVEGKCWEYQSSDFTEQVDRCPSSCQTVSKKCNFPRWETNVPLLIHTAFIFFVYRHS